MSGNTKQARKLDLDPSTGPKEELATKTVPAPLSIVLGQDRQQHYDAYEKGQRDQRMRIIKAIEDKRESKVLVFYSTDTLDRQYAELFYEIIQGIGKVSKLDLILLSPGGFADQAFNMALWCQRYSDEFNVIVPSYAKSAATLLSLGADNLLMGPPSELGPVDPQIEIIDEYGRKMRISALSIKDALRVIEEETNGDAEKAVKYMPLIEKLDLKVLGQYERAIQSAKQYAIELLSKRNLLKDKNAKEKVTVNGQEKEFSKKEIVAHDLTEGYYSHGYAIGPDKAKSMGLNVLYPGEVGFSEDLWNSVWTLHKMHESIIRHSSQERIIDGKIIEYTRITTLMESSEFYIPIEKKFTRNLSDLISENG